MMRSLYSGVTALRSHQLRMDVIGNNIANVNTVGYKASTVNFKEMLSQTLSRATMPHAGRGGTNPVQIGNGVDVGAVTTIHTPGSTTATGVGTDLAVEGNGFFIVTDGTKNYYTRAGAFDFDGEGNLVSLVTGMKVMGYLPGTGNTRQLAPIRVPKDTVIPPTVTTRLSVVGNLDARLNGSIDIGEQSLLLDNGAGSQAHMRIVLESTGVLNEWTWRVEAAGATVSGSGGIINVDSDGNWTASGSMQVEVGGTTFTVTPPTSPPPIPGGVITFNVSDGTDTKTITGNYEPPKVSQTTLRVFDSRGEAHDVFIDFVKVTENVWRWEAKDVNGDPLGNGGTLTYDTTGKLVSQTGGITIPLSGSGADDIVITPDFSSITQYAEASDVTKANQDGFPAGTLTTISLDTAGRVMGAFSNGLMKELAQIALADFDNPSGLIRAGASLFEESVNSGQADIGVAGTGSRGTIAPEMLEASNVDLSQEFTNMIVTQRGFQANSRVITTTDEMLQELVNLKR